MKSGLFTIVETSTLIVLSIINRYPVFQHDVSDFDAFLRIEKDEKR